MAKRERSGKSERSELVQTFVEEHRTLMRGLATILERVEAADFAAARNDADELDQVVGPHIQFEEELLYPEVGRARGVNVERELLEEHAAIRHAMQRLLEADLSRVDLSALQTELQGLFRVAVEHAESCGTLISHLRALSPSQQQAALSRLQQLRARGVRWTELAEKSNERAET